MKTLLDFNTHRQQIAEAIAQKDTLVISLCADWCQQCVAWKTQFAEFEVQENQQRIWLDIDEYADMVAEVDISVFPVLVIYKENQIAFCGSVRPDKITVNALIRCSSPSREIDDPGILDFFLDEIECGVNL